MIIRYVTCSGVNEHTNIKSLLRLLNKYLKAEIGVQVNEIKCSYNSDRMNWIKTLVNELQMQKMVINAALHVNPSWVEEVGQGILPPELQTLMSMRNFRGDPFFQRIQLNFKIGRDRTPDEHKLLNLMQLYKSRRFIFSYNESNAEFIGKMRELCLETGVKFDLLYDDSHGEGIIPKERRAPVFKGVRQGYAGGIGPENVTEVLDEIVRNFPGHYATEITIDAEGRLKGDKHRIDLNRCASYLEAVKLWYLNQS